jgi:hypothetical protein
MLRIDCCGSSDAEIRREEETQHECTFKRLYYADGHNRYCNSVSRRYKHRIVLYRVTDEVYICRNPSVSECIVVDKVIPS